MYQVFKIEHSRIRLNEPCVYHTLLRFRLCYCSDTLAYCSALCSLFLFFSQICLRFYFSRSAQCSNNTFLEKEDSLPPTGQQFTFRRQKKYSCLHSNRREKMPLVESTCCMNCHKILQRIAVLEQSYLLDFQNRRNIQQMVTTDPLSIQPVSPVNLVNLNSLYQV